MKKELPPTSKLISNVVFFMSNGQTVLISCSNSEESKKNLFALSWLSFATYSPPLFLITVSKGNYSHNLIKECKDFVINVPTAELKEAVLQAGSIHGNKIDKIKKLGLTTVKAKTVKSPLIEECFLNIECKVIREFEFGDCTVFLGEPTAIHYNEDVLTDKGFNERYKNKSNQVHYLDVSWDTA